MKVKKVSIVKWSVLLLVFSLALATVFSLKYVDRFYVEKEQLLLDPGFLEGVRYWKQSEYADVTFQGRQLIFSSKNTVWHWVSQSVAGSVLGESAYVRLTLNASSRDVVAEDTDGAGGGVLMVFRDSQGGILSGDRLVLLTGSHLDRQYSHTEYLAEQPHSIDIIIRLSSAAGIFKVSNPVLSVLGEFPFYSTMKTALLLVWVVVALVLVFAALKIVNSTQMVVLFLAVGVALVGTLLPEQVMTGVSQKVMMFIPDSIQAFFRDLLVRFYSENKLSDQAGISKTGHIVVFAVLGGLAGFYYQKIGLVFSLASVGVFALITESMQMFVAGRTTSAEDLIIDCIAGFLGVAVGVFLSILLHKR